MSLEECHSACLKDLSKETCRFPTSNSFIASLGRGGLPEGRVWGLLEGNTGSSQFQFPQELCPCCQACWSCVQGGVGFLKQKTQRGGGEVCRRGKSYLVENRALQRHQYILIVVQLSAFNWFQLQFHIPHLHCSFPCHGSVSLSGPNNCGPAEGPLTREGESLGCRTAIQEAVCGMKRKISGV